MVKANKEEQDLISNHEIFYGYIIFPPYNGSPYGAGGNWPNLRYRFKIKNRAYEAVFGREKFCKEWSYKHRLT